MDETSSNVTPDPIPAPDTPSPVIPESAELSDAVVVSPPDSAAPVVETPEAAGPMPTEQPVRDVSQSSSDPVEGVVEVETEVSVDVPAEVQAEITPAESSPVSESVDVFAPSPSVPETADPLSTTVSNDVNIASSPESSQSVSVLVNTAPPEIIQPQTTTETPSISSVPHLSQVAPEPVQEIKQKDFKDSQTLETLQTKELAPHHITESEREQIKHEYLTELSKQGTAKKHELMLEKKERIMELFKTKPIIKHEDVMELLDVSGTTATRLLADLKHEGRIKFSGKGGNGAYYTLP
jgi:hypothetical protein